MQPIIFASMKAHPRASDRIEAVRRFNRFYTKKIGVLREGLLNTRFSLAQARVLFELANTEKPSASAIAAELGLDPGYLSRILRGFAQARLLKRLPSPTDRRQSILSLTKKGNATFARLDAASRAEMGRLLAGLSSPEQARLVESMKTIQTILGDRPRAAAPYLLRSHAPGDMGWIVHRHGVLYAQEYGWDERFEALVAAIVAEFIAHEDPALDRSWIAERDGEIVGSAFLVKETKRVARLRLFLVEPRARGLGIGTRLVDECTRFARQAGYRKIVLWTQDVLHSARRIYARAGYQLVKAEPHDKFGKNLVGETWELAL
jgi:DNA-binding MarR family transcriptional regulator/GNAT superfamily N-acetyltransferase